MYYCQRKPKNRKNGVGLETSLPQSLYKLQVASLDSLAQLLCRAAAPPLCPLHVQLLLPHCVRFMFSCCSPTVSASCSAAAPRLHPLHVQLLLPHCVRFMFSCCSPTVSASCSAAAPPLCPLHVQLLLPDCIRFSCFSLLASASKFNCCSPIASTSVAAPRSPIRFDCCSSSLRLHAFACSLSWIPAHARAHNCLIPN